MSCSYYTWMTAEKAAVSSGLRKWLIWGERELSLGQTQGEASGWVLGGRVPFLGLGDGYRGVIMTH